MKPWMKTSLFAVWPLAGALGLAPLGVAEQEDRVLSRDEHQVEVGDLQSFQEYLDSHQETAQLLARHPELLRDHRFVREHHALHDWLEAHPTAAKALRANPERYLPRTEGYRAGTLTPRG